MTTPATVERVQDAAKRRLTEVQTRVMSNKQAASAIAGGAVLALLILARARRTRRG